MTNVNKTVKTNKSVKVSSEDMAIINDTVSEVNDGLSEMFFENVSDTQETLSDSEEHETVMTIKEKLEKVKEEQELSDMAENEEYCELMNNDRKTDLENVVHDLNLAQKETIDMLGMELENLKKIYSSEFLSKGYIVQSVKEILKQELDKLDTLAQIRQKHIDIAQSHYQDWINGYIAKITSDIKENKVNKILNDNDIYAIRKIRSLLLKYDALFNSVFIFRMKFTKSFNRVHNSFFQELSHLVDKSDKKEKLVFNFEKLMWNTETGKTFARMVNDKKIETTSNIPMELIKKMVNGQFSDEHLNYLENINSKQVYKESNKVLSKNKLSITVQDIKKALTILRSQGEHCIKSKELFGLENECKEFMKTVDKHMTIIASENLVIVNPKSTM